MYVQIENPLFYYIVNITCLIWITLQTLFCVVQKKIYYNHEKLISNKLALILHVINYSLLLFSLLCGITIAIITIISIDLFILPFSILCISSLICIEYVFNIWRGQKVPLVVPDKNNNRFVFSFKGQENVSLLFGGDVSFDTNIKRSVCFSNKSFSSYAPIAFSWITKKPELPIPWVSWNPNTFLYKNATAINISKKSNPFKKIEAIMQAADCVCINLESPLVNNRRIESYRIVGDPQYAELMKKSGVTVVNLSNNHCFDAEEAGVYETMTNLERVGIAYTGMGHTLSEARTGTVKEIGGMKISFLGYTQKVGRVGMEYAVANNDRVGCLPLDPGVIKEDIMNAKKISDYVFVTPHWGVEGYHTVSRTIRKLAHFIIDCGADGIFGHGPHLYQGVEIYNDRPIVYSLGTLIFGFYLNGWKNNIISKVLIRNGFMKKIELIPISGITDRLWQPSLLEGVEAQKVLRHIQRLSYKFGTKIQIEDNKGIITIAEE